MAMSKNKIWSEMARRKVRFHNDQEWYNIKLWGLFTPSSIKPQIERGELIPHDGIMPHNRSGWFCPSEDAYNTFIKPLIDKHSLDDLTLMAGWDV